jgi:hypothetical protein
VDAPEGTVAQALAPPARVTTQATVGVPRESSASKPRIASIERSAMHATLPALPP